jgi:hypothetical protein
MADPIRPSLSLARMVCEAQSDDLCSAMCTPLQRAEGVISRKSIHCLHMKRRLRFLLTFVRFKVAAETLKGDAALEKLIKGDDVHVWIGPSASVITHALVCSTSSILSSFLTTFHQDSRKSLVVNVYAPCPDPLNCFVHPTHADAWTAQQITSEQKSHFSKFDPVYVIRLLQ